MAYKVMIVDDAAMMRLYISSFLNSLPDFKVAAQAANGREALDKLSEIPDLDLILLDIEMPVMDGLEFLRHAKLKTRAKICMLPAL
ncbi:Chemotaxis protein CheY [Thalassovita autumnalis]|uniref:Chemotaxis protein CheY n=1 Tax=Thalassovita autumnalis TaxID=2072972 RepID=A0A0P1FT79_9RHOB|nr:response regulator [Thalassovita autumnalis]CUH64602.1 Chemotaxis protein CheY [Thalassovita autumnalis]CUH71588.1 Chemotaxis protein CheY [Thalassovita autumnalis]